MKSFVSFVLVLILIFIPVSASAATYSLYSSVTASTSQISLLIDSMHNQRDYNPFRNWVAFRTDQNDYSLFYNIKDDRSAIRLRYYATNNGYTTVWHFTKTNETNFAYNPNEYTYAGNISGSLGSQNDSDFLHNFIFKFTVPFILVLFIFFIFRVKKRSRGVMPI